MKQRQDEKRGVSARDKDPSAERGTGKREGVKRMEG